MSTDTNMGGRRRTWFRFAAGRVDETVLLWAYRVLLVATFVVLGLDLAEMQRNDPEETAAPGLTRQAMPYLPSVREDFPERTGSIPVEAPSEAAGIARFELVEGGRLMFSGTIVPGTAERFRAEIDKRGSYVKTVVLNSPGGSVKDALAIAGMIREAGFDTEVGPKAYCVSSCPLVFAGGKDRITAPDASIGVHRIFATSENFGGPEKVMVEAQRVSAEIQRLLIDMGIDPAAWLYAMETPKDELFYFTPEEMLKLKLATRVTGETK